jgi:hypothetical protein
VVLPTTGRGATDIYTDLIRIDTTIQKKLDCRGKELADCDAAALQMQLTKSLDNVRVLIMAMEVQCIALSYGVRADEVPHVATKPSSEHGDLISGHPAPQILELQQSMDGVESVTAQGLGLGVEYKYINGSDVFQGYRASANLAAIVKNKVVRACASKTGFVQARCATPDVACIAH